MSVWVYNWCRHVYVGVGVGWVWMWMWVFTEVLSGESVQKGWEQVLLVYAICYVSSATAYIIRAGQNHAYQRIYGFYIQQRSYRTVFIYLRMYDVITLHLNIACI